jgi:hypothetical protein
MRGTTRTTTKGQTMVQKGDDMKKFWLSFAGLVIIIAGLVWTGGGRVAFAEKDIEYLKKSDSDQNLKIEEINKKQHESEKREIQRLAELKGINEKLGCLPEMQKEGLNNGKGKKKTKDEG